MCLGASRCAPSSSKRRRARGTCMRAWHGHGHPLLTRTCTARASASACLQVAVIEFCRTMLGKDAANSTEINPNTPHPVVLFMPEGSKTHMGGTMRLGARRTVRHRAPRTPCPPLRVH